jgi:uncharacterized protein YifN (PemK superfamily)
MGLAFHPSPGTILMCDFSNGFTPPEMVKKRPVVVISPKRKRCAGLVTVVPLSTVAPTPVESFHIRLDSQYLPTLPYFQSTESWVKCDMVYRLGFSRLDLIKIGKEPSGKRIYFKSSLPDQVIKCIQGGVLQALQLGYLVEHLR